LALRAAKAAGSTAELIKDSIRKTKEGSTLVDRTNSTFSQVVDSTSKAGELIEEIAVASEEQSKGIEQINNAVSEMDKVTQHNAASSEESASASEEMHSQTGDMSQVVDNLVALISGSGSKNGQHAGQDQLTKSAILKRPIPCTPKERISNQQFPLIPLNNDEFKDF